MADTHSGWPPDNDVTTAISDRSHRDRDMPPHPGRGASTELAPPPITIPTAVSPFKRCSSVGRARRKAAETAAAADAGAAVTTITGYLPRGINARLLPVITLGTWMLYSILGRTGEFMCNLVGIAYPVWVSFLALKDTGPDKEANTRWLTFWCVYGCFRLIDFPFSMNPTISTAPIYWTFKCLFLLYLHMPQTSGADWWFDCVVEPFLEWVEKAVNKLEQAMHVERARLKAAKEKLTGANSAANSHGEPAAAVHELTAVKTAVATN